MSSLNDYWKFLGRRVGLLFGVDLFLGVFWFFAESGFLFVFQGFLLSIGLLDISNLRLPDWYPHDLNSNLLIFAGYGMFRAVLTGAKKVVPALASQTFVADQRARILKQSFLVDHGLPTSEVLGAFGELASKSGAFVLHLAHTIAAVVLLVLLLVLSLKLAPYETILSVATLSILMIPLKVFNKKIRRSGEELNKEWNRANKILLEGLRNIFFLRLYRLTQKECESGLTRIAMYEEHYTKFSYLSGMVSSVPLALGLIIVTIITFVSKQYFGTDPLNFIGFLYLFMRIAQTASTLSTSWSTALFYKASFMKLYAWKNHFAEKYSVPPMDNVPKKLLDEPVSIDVRNLTFGYNAKSVVFRDIKIQLSPGKLLLIKGPSGSGKSTFIKLLVGILEGDSGEMLISGMTPKDFVANHSSQVGYVGPEPYLIPGTLRENILYGNSMPVDEDEIWQSLRDVGMESTIKNLNLGLDEELKEETQLSTGQKQRLSFARAILRKPRLLILDEATANIDYATEKSILGYLSKLKNTVTVVAVSHRESFDDLADVQIAIEQG